MKGPQKSCCREFLKRKLDSMLSRGRNMNAELVAARLSGSAKTLKFDASQKAAALSLFERIFEDAQWHLGNRTGHGGLLGTSDDKGKRKTYEITLLLKEV